MRRLEIGSHRFTEVLVIDEPGQGNAHHEYRVSPTDQSGNPGSLSVTRQGEFGVVRFQNGPVNEAGVNGCADEDLIAIVIHRLACFQSGPYSCRENALALTKLEEAMHWLNQRTASRQKRSVEGTHIV